MPVRVDAQVLGLAGVARREVHLHVLVGEPELLEHPERAHRPGLRYAVKFDHRVLLPGGEPTPAACALLQGGEAWIEAEGLPAGGHLRWGVASRQGGDEGESRVKALGVSLRCRTPDTCAAPRRSHPARDPPRHGRQVPSARRASRHGDSSPRRSSGRSSVSSRLPCVALRYSRATCSRPWRSVLAIQTSSFRNLSIRGR